ncbi:MAG TPA: ParA family protein [Polyangium sp.]|nr:ParA family protein [Polyangium sp.]
MNIRPLYTWRDVERVLAESNQVPWDGAVADTEALVIFCPPKKEAECLSYLRNLFGVRFRSGDGTAHLELIAAPGAQRPLRVVFVHEAPPVRTTRTVRPLWAESPQKFDVPRFPEGSPPIIAFYSFKGGVGRTTILLSALGALLDRKKPARVLVVDADIEAPGLTLQISGTQDRFTLIDYFSLIHDAEDWTQEAVPIAVDRLNVPEFVELGVGRREFYFLPAFRLPQVPVDPNESTQDQALFAPDVLPEHLVRYPGRAFVVGDSLAALGKALNVDAVLVDLRAGVSEISSPFMLDPRLQHVLVSACGFQSFEGTRSQVARSVNTAMVHAYVDM